MNLACNSTYCQCGPPLSLTLPLLERAHVVEHQLVEQLLPCWLPHCLLHQVSAAIVLERVTQVGKNAGC